MKVLYELHSSTWTAGLAWRWSSLDISWAAHKVVSEVMGVGALLPLTHFAGARIFPVVQWRSNPLLHRLEQAARPLLDPALVRDVLEDDHRADDCPTVLSIVGFVSVAPLPEAREELAGLRSLGRTLAVIPRRSVASTLTLAEFDLQGTGVVSLDDELRILVDGEPGIHPGARMSEIWVRFYEEQLFDWAMRSETLPAVTT